jgi:hypothetical protein
MFTKYFFGFSIFLFSIFFAIPPVMAADIETDVVHVQLGVDGCDNNGICEDLTGETILTCPNDCTPTPPANISGGFSAINFLYDITTEPGLDFAIVRFKTWTPVFATVRWGKTAEVTSGIIKNPSYLMNHVFYLPNLEPSTTYFFSIEYQNNIGYAVSGYVGLFRTLNPPIALFIPNPTDVHTRLDPAGIPLFWRNPVLEDFAYVRVMRNTDHFYASPFVGELVYEGTGEYVFDENVQSNRQYYYTFFTRTQSGEFSSGVGLTAFLGERGDGFPEFFLSPSVIGDQSSFTISQDGRVVSALGGVVDGIDGNLWVYIQSTSALPPFQDIWLSLSNSKGQNNFYLLKYDINKKIYELGIPPLLMKGDYDVKVYQFLVDKTVLLDSGTLRVVAPSLVFENDTYASPKSLLSLFYSPIFWIWLLILLILLLVRKTIYR